MSFPQDNDTISLVFTGTLDNGEVFYIVDEEQPLTITLGNNDLPPSVELALRDMKVGDTKKIRVPPEEGYGPRQQDLLQTIESEEMVNSLKPIPGMILSLRVDGDAADQPQVPATVTEVNGNIITVDYNHPLAGHHLNYEITLKKIHARKEDA